MSSPSSSSRRQFITKITAGASLAVSSSSVFGDHHTGKKLGYALVGLGGLSTNQIAPALLKTKHCRLAGIVTGTPAKEKVWAEKYGIPQKSIYNYKNFDSIADNPDIDVVYVVLPNSMHKEYTVRAAKAGKHVLCEKPMATSAADCEIMIAACAEAKRKLAIGYRCQFEPHHLECIRLVREKTFGDLKMIDAGFGFKIGDPNQWRLKHALAGGGGLMDVGIKGATSDGPIKFESIDQFAAEMDDFSQCIKEDRATRVPGEEGLKDLRVIEAIYKSIRTGAQVKLG